MEDDIDIEEHDLLDNPKIRDIFPDLSLVKTEVPDDDEDMQDQECQMELDYGIIKEENTNFDENNTYEQSDNFENNEFDQNELISDNQQTDECNISEFEQSDQHNISELEQSASDNTCEIQQIEETLPNYQFEETENYGFQNNEFQFTNKIILGSKPSYDDLYQEALHSKASVFLEDWSDRLTNSVCYCNNCEILFPTVNAYDAHKSISHSFLVALDIPRPNTARKSTAPLSKYCNHCDRTFPNDTALIKHLYELLPLNQFKPTPEPVKVIAKNPYKCIKCNKYFATLNDGKEHKRVAHPTMNNVNIICKVVSTTDEVETVAKKKDTVDLKLLSTTLVPQSVLFQCNICQINFVSCFSAMQHARKCSNNTHFTKCNICKRKIRAKDGINHERQHKFMLKQNAKFKVYTLNKNMYDKVLLKCPKCVICFDEKSFWIHYKTCNSQRISYSRCNICSIDVTTARITNHKSKHTLHKCKKKDFIVVEFHQLNKSVTKVPISNKIQEKICLYYCHTCGSYKNVFSQRGHKNGACKSLKVVFCDLCGLGFGTENYKLHKILHQKRAITLNDYKIRNVFTGVEIEIPIPNFHRCKHCKLHFLTKEKCMLHNCVKEVYEFCQICNKKFEVNAHELHSNFHTYSDIPELMKKYNSINNMWNVVYECSTCNLVTVTYDTAVEHCQNHMNELPRPLSKRCKKCDFDIIEEHYKLHMTHHDNNVKIDRCQFKILKFNFEHLYAKEWMTMFETLPKAHKYQILSRSVYRITRRFKVNCDSNSVTDDYKLYCMKCKTNILMEEMTKHYMDKNCKISSKFVCKTCHLQFQTLNECMLHEAVHESVQKSYKVITYNDKKDEQFDERLKDFELVTKNPIKIPSPNKIIKPVTQKSSKNIKYPTKNTKIITKITKTDKTFKSRKSVKEIVKVTNRLKLYKCALCDSCVSLRCNIMKHKCSMYGKSRTKFCKICKQSFYNRHYLIHIELHKQFPRLKKPLIVIFNPKSKNLPFATVFQCECGLHFTSKQTIDRHIEICDDKNDDISRETCSKCNLIFPTDVLVSHLCKHHSKPMDIKVQLIKNDRKKGPFQCSKCNVIYSSMIDYDDHIFNCNSHAKNCNKCPECNLSFDRKSFPDHNCGFNQKMTVIKKSVAVFTMFKCSKCNICYLSRKSIDYHFEIKHINRRDTITCDICKLCFTTTSHKNHLLIHSAEENYMIKVIDANTNHSTIIRGKNNITPSKKTKNDASIAKRSPDKNIKSPKDDQKTPTIKKVDHKKPVSKSDVAAPFLKTLYRCSVCKFCFSYKKRLEDHVSIGRHTGCIDCNFCGLKISKRLMLTHQLLHKNDREYVFEIIEPDTGKTTIVRGKNSQVDSKSKRKRNAETQDVSPKIKISKKNNDSLNNENDNSGIDFESVNMNDTETEFDNDSIDNSSIMTDPLNNTDPINDIDKTITNKAQNKMHTLKTLTKKGMSLLDSKINAYTSTLYKCMVCKLHFITESTIYWHLKLSHKKPLQSHNCDKCRLNFSFVTLARHDYIHHKKMRLRNAKSFTILEYDYDTMPHKYATQKKDNAMSPTTRLTNTSAPITPVSLSDVIEIEADKSIEIDDADEIVDAPVVPSTNNEVGNQQKNIKIHYFKCVDCNVCFINEKTCRVHISKHVLLDPKTYIECKICNFQFLISSLKHHIATQHKSEFRLEDLTIIEYKAIENSDPIVDTYRGIDYVQSRLVSTTTDVVVGTCDSNTVGNSTS